MDTQNAFYSSVDGVLFDKSQTTLIYCPQGKAGTCTIPGSVRSIGANAFSECYNLRTIMIPNSVSEHRGLGVRLVLRA